ncbi:hypothetical protein A2U01_0012446, partial [Trifolium medium]|nr:hypothetical protein [Trifolium medium]
MVILRELSDSEDGSSEIPLFDSDRERQIRSQYTRPDGTLNEKGYFSELWGFPVASSDLGSSDSDDDSDCVVISPSSFTPKNPNNRALVVADSVSTLSSSMEISSRFTTPEFVTAFRKAVKLSGSKDENHIIVEPVNEGEFVTTVNSVLKAMDVAPSQLHPNSWAFIKAFEIMCHGFEPGRGRFSHYASNFKNYRDTFLSFRCGDDFSDLMFDNCGKPLFPFYWSSSPRPIRGAKMESLSDFEQMTV